jgi:hypothetical protein
MNAEVLPRVRLKAGETPPPGTNIYQAIPEMVEFRQVDTQAAGVCTLAIGRLALTLDSESGELVGVRSYVKTGRWRKGEKEPPPEPDAEGVLFLEHPCGEDGFAHIPAELRFIWYEESSSLRISLGEGAALILKVADCLMVGVDREGHLADFWLLGIDLSF